ncbi:MAG: hypothetical protein V3T24_02945 [Longimicrobiales bacterium]
MTPLEKVYPKQTSDGGWGCPDCGCTNFKLGPSGGLSQNVECVDCEMRWNATFMNGIPWERLSSVWERLEAKERAT